MQAKRLSVNIERKVWDVNILAIYLVSDHPGNKYVTPIVNDGLRGSYIPVLMDILPIRAYWIMERIWKIDRDEAAKAVIDFLNKYKAPLILPLEKNTIIKAFNLAKKLKHNVYDCTYLAFCKQVGAISIITTDTDFKKLSKAVNIKYENPVPEEVLKKFKNYRIDLK